MSKKTTIIGIVLLVLGVIAVPSGIFASNYIRTSVYEGVDDALLDIQDGVIDDAQDTVATLAIPEVILGIKAEADAALPDIVRGATSATLINGTIYGAIPGFGSLQLAMEYFFNDPAWTTTTGGLLPLAGISEVITGGMMNLSFTPAAQTKLMQTGTTITTELYNKTIPGIIADTDFGFGVLYFLQAYQYAASSVPGVNASMLSGYGPVTWDQLTAMAGYLSTYMLATIVPGFLAGLGTTAEEMAEEMFYAQWANGTLEPTGLDLRLFTDLLTEEVKGLEAGVPTPTGIPLDIAMDMFNDTLPLAFTNEMGIMAWAYAAQGDTGNATAILSFFTGLTPTQLNAVANWLFVVFKPNVLPAVLLAFEGLTLWELTNIEFFLPQWANGTWFPTGLELPVPKKGKGWEVGITDGVQTPTGMSVEAAELLFTESNVLSLVNEAGLKRWYKAEVNDSNYVALKAANLLEDSEMVMIMEWLPKFRDNVVPYLAQEDQNLPTDAYTLADGLLYGLMIPGIALIALGAVAIIIALVKRKS